MTKLLDGPTYILSLCPGRRAIGVKWRQEQEGQSAQRSHRPLPNNRLQRTVRCAARR